MSETIAAEAHYTIMPECPVCETGLQGQAEEIDAFHDRDREFRHIIDCNNCEERLELVIFSNFPTCVEVWVTHKEN